MNIMLAVYKYILKFFYVFFKMFKTKEKRILFLSRQSDELTIDYKYLIKNINDRCPDFECIVLTKRMDKTNFLDVVSYVFHPFLQLYYLSTSKLCIVDGYQISVSVLKHKKSLKVIQIWHSLGAIKKFGYESLNNTKDRKVAKIMCMHKNYDYIVSPSKEMSKLFSKCFNYDLGKFINIGTPKIDYIQETLNSNKKMVYETYPNLKNKKVILYVPTYRKNSRYCFDEIKEYFKKSDYELIIRKHPNIKQNIEGDYSDVSTLELLSIADYVITDYSAIILEASLIRKKVLLYTYDYQEYSQNEGININLYKSFKPYIFDDLNSLDNILKSKYDFKYIDQFKEKYISCTEDVTNKLVDKMMEAINEKN